MGTRMKQRDTRRTIERRRSPIFGLRDPETESLVAWISGRHFHLVLVACGSDMIYILFSGGSDAS